MLSEGGGRAQSRPTGGLVFTPRSSIEKPGDIYRKAAVSQKKQDVFLTEDVTSF
jgi:hypothetical protein